MHPVSNAVYGVERSLNTKPRPKHSSPVYHHGTCTVNHRTQEAAAKCVELLKGDDLVYSVPGQGFHVTGKTGLPRAGGCGLVVAAEVLVTGGGHDLRLKS